MTPAIYIYTISPSLQNGTLMDGLLLWKSNLDKHFSGVEDCMICFSVIHGSLYSLPKMTCRTCKKKFHSACLVGPKLVVCVCEEYWAAHQVAVS